MLCQLCLLPLQCYDTAAQLCFDLCEFAEGRFECRDLLQLVTRDVGGVAQHACRLAGVVSVEQQAKTVVFASLVGGAENVSKHRRLLILVRLQFILALSQISQLQVACVDAALNGRDFSLQLTDGQFGFAQSFLCTAVSGVGLIKPGFDLGNRRGDCLQILASLRIILSPGCASQDDAECSYCPESAH